MKNVGNEKPMNASRLAMWSKIEYGRTAEYTPTGKAISSARTCDEPMMNKVAGKRWRIRVSTSIRLTKEKPQSPCSIAESQCK